MGPSETSDRALPGNERPVSMTVIHAGNMPSFPAIVAQATWQCIDKQLLLTLNETPTMAALRWIEGINARRAAACKSPLGGKRQDYLTLTFRDAASRPAGILRLTGLEVVSHSCPIVKGGDVIQHHIAVAYDDLEWLSCSGCDVHATSHDEWSSERADFPD